MKNVLSFVVTVLVFLFTGVSAAVAAEPTMICRLEAGPNDPNGIRQGKLIDSINQARLPKGETCSTWIASKNGSPRGQEKKGCELRARGNEVFEGFGELPPKRDTMIVRGLPENGESCDDYRQRMSNKLLIKVIE